MAPPVLPAPPAREMKLRVGAEDEVPCSALALKPAVQGSPFFTIASNNKQKCKYGNCLCSCHHISRRTASRTWLDGSSIDAILTRCSCTYKSFYVTLRAFQRHIRLAFNIDYSDGIRTSVVLRPVMTVPATSPLFRTLAVAHHCQVPLRQLLTSIESIIDDGKASIHDVNRGGSSFMEVCQDVRFVKQTSEEY